MGANVAAFFFTLTVVIPNVIHPLGFLPPLYSLRRGCWLRCGPLPCKQEQVNRKALCLTQQSYHVLCTMCIADAEDVRERFALMMRSQPDLAQTWRSKANQVQGVICAVLSGM